MLRYSLVLMLTVIGLSAAASRPVYAASSPSIAVVDMQRVLTASKEGQRAQKAYEIEVKKAQESVDKKKGEYESLKKAFDKQRDSLNQQAKAQKEEELIGIEKEVARSFQDAKEQLKRKNMTLVASLVKDIRKTVDEVGNSEGYMMILDKNSPGVLFASETNDITDKVIELYNSQGSKK